MNVRIGTGRLGVGARHRTPLALAAACLLTGAAGLLLTFERPHSLVPFDPTNYPRLEQSPPAGDALAGIPRDPLALGDALTARLPDPEPTAAPAPLARASAAAAGAAPVVELPPPMPTPTTEATNTPEAPAPPPPATTEAVAPPIGPSSGTPSNRVITIQTGSSVVTVGGGASISTNKGAPSGPNVTNNKPSPTPIASPTTQPHQKTN